MASNQEGASTTHIASWGVAKNTATAVKSLAQGVVTSWEETANFKAGELFNEIGSLVGRDIYDYEYDVSATVQCEHGTKPPKASQKVQVNGKSYFCVNARYAEQNRDYCKITMSLKASKYSNNGDFQVTHVGDAQ